MKIHLKNFRCYEDKEFDFGEIGLVLLSGASGSGKSTILNGIYFALYGEGTKVIMYGKNNCKVEVDFGDIKIIRTKRPNHLSVTIKKQDEE
jgi:exonuclease SbcC